MIAQGTARVLTVTGIRRIGRGDLIVPLFITRTKTGQ
jgi:hypothetical protein